MDPVISRHNSPEHSGLAPGGAPHHTILLDYHDGDDDSDNDEDDDGDDDHCPLKSPVQWFTKLEGKKGK